MSSENHKNDLFYARGSNGVLIGETKNDVFVMTQADESPDDRAHWPIDHAIPDSPNRAFALSEQRRQAAEEEMLGSIALTRPAEQSVRHVIDVE